MTKGKRLKTKALLVCAYCKGPAEGRYSIHRDGMGDGPEVALCNEHGSKIAPTEWEIWAVIKADGIRSEVQRELKSKAITTRRPIHRAKGSSRPR